MKLILKTEWLGKRLVLEGFTCYRPELAVNEYDLVYIKNVPQSEISELYKIKTHAIYKGEAVNIIGGRDGTNLLTLSPKDLFPYHPTGEQLEIINRLKVDLSEM